MTRWCRNAEARDEKLYTLFHKHDVDAENLADRFGLSIGAVRAILVRMNKKHRTQGAADGQAARNIELPV